MTKSRSHARSAATGALLLLLCAFIPAFNILGAFSRSQLLQTPPAERWGRQVLAGLPQGAVIFAQSNTDRNIWGYLLRVLKLRPDVTLIDATETSALQKKRIAQFISSGHAIYGTSFAPEVLPKAWRAVSDGFYFELTSDKGPGARLAEAETFFKREFNAPFSKTADWGPFWRSRMANFIGTAYVQRALTAFNQGKIDEFKQNAATLKLWYPYSPSLLLTTGQMYAQAGPKYLHVAYDAFKGAILVARALWLTEPSQAWFLLGQIDLKTQHPIRGIYHLDQATRLNPNAAVAYFQIGLILGELGKCELAEEKFNLALAIDPSLGPRVPKPSRDPSLPK